VVNSAICVRTPGDIFRQWRDEHGVGGDAFAERMWKYQDLVEKDLCVEEVPEKALGRSNKLAIVGDERADLGGHVMRRYVKGCEGSGQCLQGCKNLKKQSTNLNYVPETMERGGTVLSCAPVDKVLLDGTRAIGVTGHFKHPQTHKKGARFTVRARKGVFVSASVTHSPVLLMRSGVKNKALGEYFRAHPGTGIFGVYDEPVDMNTGATQGWASTKYRSDPGMKLETLAIPLELVASRLSGGGRQLMERLGKYRHLAMWVHACRAESVGRVRPAAFGLSSKPMVRYGLHRADMIRFREGMKTVARMHFEAGAKEIVPGIQGMPYSLKPDQLRLLDDAPLDPRAYVAILSHLFGGCVMGTDPRTSVCDENGRVHGYDGLHIADASMIPTNLGVNPQHTIMALAMHAADRALEAN
jgi:choline dehydrogenase-like flavoprotein